MQRQRPRVTHRSAKISRMPKMLTWLLSLAVAAAASPPLNVTLTNNLLGVSTVRVNGAGLRVEATLAADSTLFHARYREVHIEEGRTIIKRRGPRPHHAGTASGEADGEFFADGRATATIEQGRLAASRRRGRCAARPTTPAPRRRRRRRRRTRSGRRHHHAGSRRMPGASDCRGRWTCRLRPLFFPSPRSNINNN